MTAGAPNGYVEITALAAASRSPLLTPHDKHCARSLIRAWSDQATAGPRASPLDLSRRQWRMATALSIKARVAPASVRYVLTKAPEARWWFDTSAHRQACRGRKSGVARRYTTRDRDARISRWVNRGVHSVHEVARHVGLALSTVSRIASRARGGTGFWRGPERYHRPDIRRRKGLREPSGNTPRALSLTGRGSRNVELFTSLTAWTGLRTVQKLPDTAVFDEAERINAVLREPMRPAELRKVVRSVCRRRRRFAERRLG